MVYTIGCCLRYLRFVELQCVRDFDASRSRQVLVEVELLFEFGQLFVGEIGAT